LVAAKPASKRRGLLLRRDRAVRSRRSHRGDRPGAIKEVQHDRLGAECFQRTGPARRRRGPDDAVAGGNQERNKLLADSAGSTGDKDSHQITLT
jgi:hypothetical protein